MRNRAWLWMTALTLLVGCVEAQDAVNRVQPNVTRKADLDGAEFYFLQTVVDTPYTTDFTFVGESGELERIVWEVQEDFLVARRAYEAIAGSDPEGINGTSETAGAPVAMYAIESHFDIRREYNTVTGEEFNVIVENSTDRPWYEREFMRVDWSTNLVSNPNFLMLARYFNGLEMEPVAWHVQENDDPANAPRFERISEDEEEPGFAYMELTNKMFVRPTTTNIPGLGPLPSCFLFQIFDGYPADCAASEITVRNSFVRVDPTHDYEPTVYSGDRMDRFGYFITERPGYDRSYGLVEPARYRFVNRHNLWTESHRRDEAGELMRCTTDAQCDDGRGSRCDIDLGRAERRLTDAREIEGACTIPFRDRETQPVVYHLSENFPAELMPEMEMLEAEWNATFVGTVASLRENECNQTGGSDCAAERARADHQEMYVVCPSPVPAGAPEACGPQGTVARIGDLRYSLLGWVNEPHRASPLGYGPSAADPITGEIIAGTAFLYGAGVDSLSAQGRDILRLLNGDLTEAEISSGAPVDAWFQNMTAGTGRGGDGAESIVDVRPDDLERIEAAMDFDWIHGGHAHGSAPRDPGEAMQAVAEARERMHRNDTFGRGEDGAGALDRLVGTPIEQMLTTRDARMMAGIDPDMPVDDSVLEAASPLRGMSPSQRAALERARAQLQLGAGIDWGEFADEGLLGLARTVQRSAAAGEPIVWAGVEYDVSAPGGGIDYDKVQEMLRHPILSGLALHEVGHTVGLRHNFSGSADSMNYHPEYWRLRDDGNMRPRNWDPMTSAEVDGRINEYAYSTVMDYGHNFLVSDAHGLGHYDHAAIKMGYGDLVEVFTAVPNTDEMAWLAMIQNAGWPMPITLATGFGSELSAYPYTEYLALAGGHEGLQARADVDYDSLSPGGVLARSGIDFNSHDAEGRVMVPYRFCSDEQADLSPGCYRYDAGADHYESVQSVIDSYWNYYIFNNFRRGRIGFNVSSTANRIHGRYFNKLQRANQSYVLWRGIVDDVFGDLPGAEEFWTAERGFGGFTAAVGASYQTLMRVITTPEPGGYSMTTRADGTRAMMSGGGEVRVDGFDGRALETTWDFDAGYYWFDQLERVGYFYDKVLALQVLTDPTTYFIGRDTDSDIRRYQISFASSFGPSMTRFFGGVLSEDWQTVAPRVQGGTLVFPDALQVEQGDMPGDPIDPNASFSIQLYAAVYGMALIPQTYDQQFLNRSRIWVRGGAEEIEVDPSLPLVEFTDENSGLTYVAVSYHDGEVEHGVGAQLLERAVVLQDRARLGDAPAARELDGYIDSLDLVRLLTWHLGFGAQP